MNCQAEEQAVSEAGVASRRAEALNTFRASQFIVERMVSAGNRGGMCLSDELLKEIVDTLSSHKMPPELFDAINSIYEMFD